MEDDTATAVDIVQEVVMEVMNMTSVHRRLLARTNSKHAVTISETSSGCSTTNRCGRDKTMEYCMDRESGRCQWELENNPTPHMVR